MLNFQLLQAQDIKEAAAIERRRRFEEERRKRIFDPRKRILGVDSHELDRQVQEKKDRELEQKKLDDYYYQKQKGDAEVALALQAKEEAERKKMLSEINEFRRHYQRKEDSREYDLNDPLALKKSLPMRLNDDDPRCGISSAQKFEGEDLASEARKKIQVEQTKAWLEQQIKEHNAAEKERKDAEDAYQAALIARDERALQLDRLEKECRTRLVKAVTDFNHSLQAQKEIEKELKHKQELEDNFAELYNSITGDFLTEVPGAAQSNLGPARSIGYMYKGMTPEETEKIRKVQLQQMEENKKKRIEEELLKKYWDDYTKQNGTILAQMDEDFRVKQRELIKQMAKYNKSLAEEQRLYKEYLDRVVYTNKPTAAFFEQFNTSSR